MKKNRWAALIIGLTIPAVFAGCGQGSNNTATDNKATVENKSETRTITDMAGREVEIPTTVNTIIPLGNAPRMITYLGLGDKAVGIENCEIAKKPVHAYAWVNKDKWSKLPIVGTSAMGEVSHYAEEIIKANPDVIICTDTADSANTLQTQTGIPVVCVTDGTLFGEDYDKDLRLIGDICGVKDKAEDLVSYIHGCLDDLSSRTANINENEGPTVLGAGATFKGAHSIDGIYTQYPVFSNIKANNVARDVGTDKDSMSGYSMVDKEKILEWDPEIIFFDANSMGLVNDDYAENPDYFNQLKAVKNGELYQWPNSTWHWTNVEIPLVSSYYVGKMLHPEEFSDVDFEKKASEIFDKFLGRPDFLTEINNSGMGYTKVTLGK